MAQLFDVAVVGLGLIGAAAVRHLAAAGRSVVGIGSTEPAERHSDPSVFASHYDSGRITRRLDADPIWAELAGRSVAGYASLERESGIVFHRPVGLTWADRDPARIDSLVELARARGVAIGQLDAHHDHGFVFPDDILTIHEWGPAGHIDPRLMLEAQLVVANSLGATLVRDVAVGRRKEHEHQSIVTEVGRAVSAKRVLVATGAYANAYGIVSRPVPLWVKGETTMLGRVDSGDRSALPALIYDLDHPELNDLYIVPPTAYPDGNSYIKVGANTTSDRILDDREAMNRWMRDEAGPHHDAFLQVLRDVVPGLALQETHMDRCLVTNTVHGRPYVANVEQDVVIAVGGNGRGAKSADAIGYLAAELVSEGVWVDPLPEHAFAVPAGT